MAIRFLEENEQDIQSSKNVPSKSTPETISKPKGVRFLEPERIRATTEQFVPNVLLREVLVDPLVEASRGLHRSGAAFYDTLQGASDLLGKVTGLDKLDQRIYGERQQNFRNIADNLRRTADELPETNMVPLTKVIYESVGGAIPIITEFALTAKAFGVAGVDKLLDIMKLNALSTPAQFATLDALKEFGREGTTESFIRGGKRGAIIGLSFPIASASLKLLWRGGKNAARGFLTWVTGDKKLAQDFVNNPNKYNVDPRGKLRTAHDVQIENKLKKEEISSRFNDRKFEFRQSQLREKSLSKAKMDNSKEKLFVASKLANESLKETSTINLAKVTKTTEKAIEGHNKTIQSELVKTYDDALLKYELLKKERGEAVGNAIDSLVKTNPAAKIPTKHIGSKFVKTVNSLSPFRIVKNQAIPRTSASNPADAKVFNNILTEVKSLGREGGYSIMYLQDLKSDLRVLSEKAFSKGNKKLGLFYQQLTKDVNPATIISGDKALSNKFKNLADVNKEFSGYITKYEQALGSYFKRGPSGKLDPDISKALLAINKNDIVALRNMRKADRALRPEDRILPNVEKIINEQNAFTSQQKSLLIKVKAKAKQEIKKLQLASTQSAKLLNKQQKNLTLEETTIRATDRQNFMRAKEQEYRSIIHELDNALEFARRQDILKSHIASNANLAGLVQRVLGFGTLSAFKSPVVGGASALGTLALSPSVASKLIKRGIVGTNRLDSATRFVLESDTFRKVFGSKISEALRED